MENTTGGFEDFEAPLPDPVRPPSDLKPHRGPLMMGLGIGSFFAPLILGPVTWLLARGDLEEMDAGRMGPAGRQETAAGRLCGMISSLAWPVLLSCCCGPPAVLQLWQGGRFVSAVMSRKVTEAEFNKVQRGMTRAQVRAILGKPARTTTERDRGEWAETWYWHEKGGPKTFLVEFRGDAGVGLRRSSWPD